MFNISEIWFSFLPSFLPSFLLIGFLLISFQANLFGQSGTGIFDRIGIITEHGLHGAVPEENIDLFTGNLTLRFLDIHLPGPNGFDLNIWRVYNSKIIKDRIAGAGGTLQQEPYSWVGLGWSMHMGRLHYANFIPNETPVIEFPDGRWETAYPNIDNSGTFITRDFLKLIQDGANSCYYLYFKNGIKWTFGDVRNINYGGLIEQVRLVTKIEDSYGHHIDIVYKSGVPVIDQITDSLGRVIYFVTEGTTNPKLTRIDVKNANGSTISYYYSVGTYSDGCYKLQSFDPPELPAATYEYNSGQNAWYELNKLTTSYGGIIEYSYDEHDFYYYNTSYVSRVVAQKKITFNQGETPFIWTYSYPSYANGNDGIVTVQGPAYSFQVTYSGMGSDIYNNGWKVGLIKQKVYNDGSYSEVYDWTSTQISNAEWIVTSLNLGKIKAPLLNSINKILAGDCPDKETYEYDSYTIKYGLPRRINYLGNNSLKYYKQLTYNFEQDSTFSNKYMLSYISKEQIFSSDAILQKETNISYFTEEGKCGAIKWIKRKRNASTELTWNYTYQEDSINKTITVTVDPPGSNSGIETYIYKYGVLARKEKPGYVEFDRTISKYDSSILSETNQHGATYNFSYDNLGRIKSVTMPSGFNNITATWSTKSVTITQGSHTIIKEWDGMGRYLGYEEQGDGITLYYKKILDPEGRVIKENKGTTNLLEQYVYSYNGAGRVIQIQDPLNKITRYTYSGTKTTIEDPLGQKTEMEFNYLPGLISNLKDPSGANAVYTYDSLGRIASVVYNNSRTQIYTYDFLDNVTSESHPETGTIAYVYNNENLLSQKSYGGISVNYEYNSSNQLTKMSTADETINYVYDSKGRINRIYSSKNWERNTISYNPFGCIIKEVQQIPGLSSMTTEYEYDGNNNLKKIIYPDSKSVDYVNNGLDMPETVSFNGQSLISQISYGINKQPTSMTIVGNGTEYNATYNSIGKIVNVSLKKSGTFLYKASYSYDAVGNVLGIGDTEPNLNATFTYDTLYRLKTADYSPEGIGRVNKFEYVYDQYGNITDVLENNSSVFHKTFNNSKNQIDGFVYDSRGNLTSDGVYQYQWDNFGRLVQLMQGGEIKGKYLYNERGLRIRALPTLPEINIKVGGSNIVSGGYVEFRVAPGSYIDKTFTIENLGDAILNLSGSPIITITGPDAGQFSVIQQPSASIAPGSTTNFIIRFSPSSSGTKNASISIGNNDFNENPYNINLLGTNPISDINLKLDGVDLSSGQAVDISCALNSTVDKTFLIENKGDGQLSLTGNPPVSISGPDANQFIITQQPATSLESGGNTSFIIRFAPTSSGNKSALLSIASNDPDENPYQINLNGIVISAGPEIDIPQAPNGGTYNFGTVKTPKSVTFTIRNLGDAPLLLTGNPPVDLEGENFQEFSVTQPGTTTIQPGASTTFRVTISPVTSGPKSAFLIIFNNDADENPYEIDLAAYAQIGAQPASIVLTEPDGQEDVEANSTTSISWVGGSNIQNLKIEYSVDNGSSYHTLAEKYGNKGVYKWRVPAISAPAGLIRISDANGLPFEPEMISYEFYFKININKRDSENDDITPFKVNLKIPDQKTRGLWQSEISIWPDKSGQIEHVKCSQVDNQLKLNYNASNRWHHLKAIFDRKTYSMSTWIDGLKVIEGAPMEVKYPGTTNSQITLVNSPGAEVLIDDLVVKVWHPVISQLGEETGSMFLPVLQEGFENYGSDGELEVGGWRISRLGDEGEEEGELLNVLESGSGLKSLKLSSRKEGYCIVSKSIALPEKYPFDVSDESFSIRWKRRTERAKEEEIRGIMARRERQVKRVEEISPRDAVREAVGSTGKSSIQITQAGGSTVLADTGVNVQSVGLTGTYYIYSFDGKLLAEYNGLGELMREYIYVGDRLLAEYQPQSNQLYYYTTDQVNSVRVVTDQAGVRVFAAAYDPYGGIQKIWENSYSPGLKFSGKERDSESNLDYFGARYYANYSYRWLSPDPVVSLDVAYTNPQAWNLYSFNRGNPVNLIDPSGLYVFDNGTPAQQKAFNEALARASLVPGLQEVTSVYGTLGEENGVIIHFLNEDEQKAAKNQGYSWTNNTMPGLAAVSLVNLPGGLTGDNLVIVIAHEGSHIADWRNLVKALTQCVEKGDYSGAGVLGNDLIDLTIYASEVKAYNYSVIAARGLGLSSLKYGLYQIMRNGRLDMKALNGLLSEFYGVSPSSPGRRLSQR